MRPSLQRTLIAVAVVGSLVLLNVLAVRVLRFQRFDLTREKMYTLSPATRELLKGLEDPVTVTAYFTENLPAPYSQNARYVRDLLQEYRSASAGKLAFEFVDPAQQESQQDKEKKREVKRDIFGGAYREPTDVEKDLASQGIQPVEVAVFEEDQRQVKRAYMALLIKYQGKPEVIPVVQGTDTLEYDLTSLLKKLTRKRAPVVVLATPAPAGENPQPKFGQLRSLFEQLYDVRTVDLTHLTEVPADADALFVLGPEKPVEEAGQRAIDSFLLKGKSAAFFVDAVRPDVRTFSVSPVDSGLLPLLSSYGVKPGDKLVADVNCGQLSVQEQRGMLRFQVPVRYPFIPMVEQLEVDSPITRGLTRVAFPFVTALSLEPREGLTETVLAKSSATRKVGPGEVGSWLESPPFNTDPRRDWGMVNPSFGGPYPLLVQVTGKLKSHFGGQTGTAESRVIVAGGSSMAWDEFMGPADQALMLNIADFLLLDPGMLAMRTRGLSEAPLKPNLSEAARNGVKYGNAIGVPLALAIYGLLRWRLRERRRAAVTV